MIDLRPARGSPPLRNSQEQRELLPAGRQDRLTFTGKSRRRGPNPQISSTDLGVRRIIVDAATSNTAPIMVNRKCHQLQLNSRVTASVCELAQDS
jgi:hypothetical protein